MNNEQVRNLVETLLIIECLSLLGQDTLDSQLKEKDDLFGDIYRLSHSSIGHCEGCKHPNMVKQDGETRRKAKESLNELGIMDVDKAVDRCMKLFQ